MKRWVFWISAALAMQTTVFAGDTNPIVFYLQLIRGSDEASPPVPGAKLIGPRLSQALHSPYRWKNYWEVHHQELTLRLGEKAKVALNKERAVKIDLTEPQKRKVTAFSEGKPVCSVTQPADKNLTMIGADRDAKSAWFVVVRRDKPSID